jgi:hypothetical protein
LGKLPVGVYVLPVPDERIVVISPNLIQVPKGIINVFNSKGGEAGYGLNACQNIVCKSGDEAGRSIPVCMKNPATSIF